MNKRTISFLSLFILSFSFFLFVDVVQAQNTIGEIPNPLNTISGRSDRGVNESGGIVNFASSIIRTVNLAAGIYMLFNIVFAGFQFVTSQGDPKMLEAARQKIIWSIIGVIVIAMSLVLTGVLSLLIFGDATVILFPKIYGPTS